MPEVAGLRVLAKLARRLSPGPLVLAYHRVAEAESDPWSLCVTPSHFAEHLEVLRQRWRPVPLARVGECDGAAGSARRHAAVTFDDGYADNLHRARPLLEASDVPATFFVVTGGAEAGTPFWWDELERLLLHGGPLPEGLELEIAGVRRRWHLGAAAPPDAGGHPKTQPDARSAVFAELYGLLWPLEDAARRELLVRLARLAPTPACAPPAPPRLTPQEVAQLAGSSLCEIGAHTATHPDLTTLPASRQLGEMLDCRGRLEQWSGRPVTTFAYPHGRYNEDSARAAQAAGFERAYAAEGGAVRRRASPWALPRLPVPDCDGEAFAALLERVARR